MTPHIRILAIALLVSTRMVSPSWADPGQTKIDLQAAHLNIDEIAGNDIHAAIILGHHDNPE